LTRLDFYVIIDLSNEGGMNMKVEMSTSEVINLLLNKEIEIDNKITNVVSELLRLGYDSERGKECIKDLRDSIEYSLDEIERILNR
jgi:hypothetical protein